MKTLQLLFFSAIMALGMACHAFAQQSGSPAQDFTELADPKPGDDADSWNKKVKGNNFTWASIDVRYPKHTVPDIPQKKTYAISGWKGERISAQAVFYSNEAMRNARLSVSDLKKGKETIPASEITPGFVRYVMTDELNKDGKSGCSERPDKSQWDSSLVADIIDIIKVKDIAAQCVQPVWLKVNIPSGTPAGKYTGTLTLDADNMQPMSLTLQVNVVDRTLPDPKDWKFHLDLWQNPYAVARYHDVPLWSNEHFELMKPIMKMLADAGQKSITTSIMHKPWAGQTQDHFDSMVTRIKKIDGTWVYDYAVFDRWVSFMMDEVGIDQLISCYTMIPWALSFDYYDEATNRVQFVNTEPGEEAYAEYWTSFLKDFSKHLREKGWFEKTAISMDERPMEAMREAIKVIKDADPEFKITLAGNYHEEIQADLYYLCIPYGHQFPEEVKAEREKRGQISTVYTCCAEAWPNTFTFSQPAEAAWTTIHATAGGYDGYLRWAVNSWPLDPLHDSRFRTWAAGDTYSIYPGPRSSIRFERLVEGIQCSEKIRILREELGKIGASGKLRQLNNCVAKFTPEGMAQTQQDAAEMVSELENLLNKL